MKLCHPRMKIGHCSWFDGLTMSGWYIAHPEPVEGWTPYFLSSTLQGGALGPGAVALDVDPYREGRYVGGIGLHVHRQGGGPSAPCLGAYACGVDALQKLPLQLGYLRVWAGLP